MKLIAIRDFANVRRLGLNINGKDEGFVHQNQVHKGYRFTIGKNADGTSCEVWEQLQEEDKDKIGALLHSRAVMFDNKENEARIQALDKQVAEERQAAKANTLDTPMTLAEQIAVAVSTALKAAGVGAK